MAKFNYGGQAVVEGVMMRGQHSAAVAIRRYSGDILLHEERLNPRLYANRWLRLPFLRGLLLLWDMLVLGTRMLMYATSASLPPETSDTGRGEQPLAGKNASAFGSPSALAGQAMSSAVHESQPGDVQSIGGPGLVITMLLSLTFVVALFFLAPLAVTGAAQRWIGQGWLSLLTEGIIRLVLLLGYLWLIGRMPGVRRVFEYHGAEHKAINTFETGLPLDVAHVRQASRVHTRCGTGFLLIVMVISIVVFALVGNPPLPLRVLSRVALVPVVAAIAYELMRLGAANYRYRVVRWLLAPGLALQGLTTREPDDGQMECAIAALTRVLERDGVPALQRVV
ncbi:MAG TPA: DUF1385 domain-containing protein [Ktedonobacterales bacterium]